MAYQTAGYYTPQMPALPPAPRMPAAPQYNPYGGATIQQVPAQQGSPDAYIQSVAVGAPMFAGALPGKASTNSVREAKAFYMKAKGTATSTRGIAQKAQAAEMGRGALWGTITGAIKSSLIFNGIFSLAYNGWQVYNKKETNGQAGANFAGDMSSAVIGGAAAGLASGAGTYLLSGMLGVGMPLTIAGMALGAIGYFVADSLWRQTSVYNQIKTSVQKAIGG